MGVYCVNNKTYTGEITGGELEHSHYHNEFYAIGNPDNEIKYDHSIGQSSGEPDDPNALGISKKAAPVLANPRPTNIFLI